MITKEQALTADYFHANGCICTIGPRGGITVKVEEWRRNGATQTWKTRPNEWRIPVKYGMYSYGQIWHHDAETVHLPKDCPAYAKEREARRLANAAGNTAAPHPLSVEGR